jgi:hypothetical protein
VPRRSAVAIFSDFFFDTEASFTNLCFFVLELSQKHFPKKEFNVGNIRISKRIHTGVGDLRRIASNTSPGFEVQASRFERFVEMKKLCCLATLLCLSFAGCGGGVTRTAEDSAKTDGASTAGAMGDTVKEGAAAKDGAAAVGDAVKDGPAAVGEAATDGAAVSEAAKEVVK